MDKKTPIESRPRPSAAVRRNNNQCRVVITLELEITPEVLKGQPSHLRAAVDYMRKHLEQFGTGFDFAEMFDYVEGAEMLDHKVEVAG